VLPVRCRAERLPDLPIARVIAEHAFRMKLYSHEEVFLGVVIAFDVGL
jgi:hypothetical protein